MARNHRFTAKFWHAPRIRQFRHALSISQLYRILTAHRRRLPDYLIVGAQKSGTTSLWGYLNEHPQVEAPRTKETNYFDANYVRGLAWYRAHFPMVKLDTSRTNPSQRMLTGESCANYMFHPLAPQRAAATLPQAKIIFLLRNPVDRAFSHYQLKLRRRQETLSFDDAIEAESERLAGERERMVSDPNYYSATYDRHSYLARGRYLEQILRWQRFYSPEQLLFLESGEFFKCTGDVYQQVLQFLELPSWQPTQFANRFPGRYDDQMSAATRHRLLKYFAPYNDLLFTHLGTRYNWDR